MPCISALKLQPFFALSRHPGCAVIVTGTGVAVRAFGGLLGWDGVSQHHNGITGCAHQVVAFLDDLAILAVVHAKFFPPLTECLIDLEAPGLHTLVDELAAEAMPG